MSLLSNLRDALFGPQRSRSLILPRPLAVFDVETTGVDPANDRIVEISILRESPGEPERFLSRRVNPQVPIPTGATQIHGITNADVEGEPPFHQITAEVSDFLYGCDLAGFNVGRFDLPMLEAEFQRAGLTFSREGRCVVDAMTIFHKYERGNLAAAARFYLDRTMPDVHRSETDVRTTLDIIRAQVEQHPDVPSNVEAWHDFCIEDESDWIDPEAKFVWANGAATITFGKHRGRTLQELAGEPEPNYLHWMLSADFSPEVMEIVRAALRGKFPTPPDGHEE